MKVSVKIPNLQKIQTLWRKSPRTMAKELQHATAHSTARLESASVREAPVDKGQLRQSITSHVKTLHGEIHPDRGTGTMLKYAEYVHEGTRPHVIVPKKGKLLCWKSGGKWRFAKKVNHPGNKPNRFFDRAVRKEDPNVQRMFEKAIANTLKSLKT